MLSGPRHRRLRGGQTVVVSLRVPMRARPAALQPEHRKGAEVKTSPAWWVTPPREEGSNEKGEAPLAGPGFWKDTPEQPCRSHRVAA